MPSQTQTQLTDVQIFARVLAAIPGSEVVAACDSSGMTHMGFGPIKLGEMIDKHCSEAGSDQEDVEQEKPWHTK